MRRLSVQPAEGGWRVEADGLASLVFSGGAQAEQQARALARGFAAAGFDVLVSVHDARQALIGTVRYFGLEQALAPDVRDRYPWSRTKAIKPV